jgi:hypothetical protein
MFERLKHTAVPLVKSKSGVQPKNKGIEHYCEHGETEPGERPKIIPDQVVSNVLESFEVNFLN